MTGSDRKAAWGCVRRVAASQRLRVLASGSFLDTEFSWLTYQSAVVPAVNNGPEADIAKLFEADIAACSWLLRPPLS